MNAKSNAATTAKIAPNANASLRTAFTFRLVHRTIVPFGSFEPILALLFPVKIVGAFGAKYISYSLLPLEHMEQTRRHVSLESETFDKLERVRKSTGMRSVAQVVKILANRAYDEQVKLAQEAAAQ